MKNTKQLSVLAGQIKGIKNMIEEDEDCFKVLTQLKAARASLNGLMGKYMQENLNSCMKNSSNKKEFLKMEKLIAEITKN